MRMSRGMGRGMGRRAAVPPTPPTPPAASGGSREAEIAALQEMAGELRKQLAEVMARINRLEKGGWAMRIVVSADNNDGLDSVVSPHFGRCPYFVLVDLEGHEVQAVQAVSNPYYGQHQRGQVPGFIHSQGADVMLTGGMGRRAIAFFQEYGIQVVTGAAGTVRHALEQYLGGGLQGARPCRESVEHHHAHGHGEVPAEDEYEQDELGRLREEAEMLQRQLDEVTEHLDRLSAS
jgi:predicted Fe-Mo cluster-binding NifX family protein